MKKGDNSISIKQSNRVTNSLRDFTVYQERVFMCIMAFLQDAIEYSFLNKDYRQLELFEKDDVVNIHIPLRMIAKPREYSELKEAILLMAEKTVSFRYFDKEGNARIYKSSIFSVDIPEKATWEGVVRLKLFDKVASYLIEISKDAKGRPIQYTKYLLNTALKLKLKYSPKLYILISSWRKKGSFYMSKEDLYDYMGVSSITEYKVFKRNILNKTYKELKESADCYFEFNELKVGRTVKGLNFKVFSKTEIDKEYQTKVENIRNMLKLHFGFTNSDIEDVQHLFDQEKFNFHAIIDKMQYIKQYLLTPGKKITDKIQYTKASLNSVYE